MSAEIAARQLALIQELMASGALTKPDVAAAFQAVPRHLFVPEVPLAEAYRDDAIPTKFAAGRPISSSSQPAIMAIMLEQLHVAPGQHVLEIGAGTGFNAALLAHLTGPSGRVTSVDIDEDIVVEARAHLSAAGFKNVVVVCADGGHGYAPNAPYDRVILTVGAWDIAPAWHEQLVPGGRLVLPLELGRGPQVSVALDRAGGGVPGRPVLVSRSVRECGFMRLRGAFAGPQVEVALGPEPGLTLSLALEPPAPAEALFDWLTAGSFALESPLAVSTREVWSGLSLWLSLHAPNLCDLTAGNGLAERGLVPCLFTFGGNFPTCLTLGLIGVDGLCLLGRRPGTLLEEDSPSTLLVQGYGPNPRALADELLGYLAGWEAAGRPGTRGLRVRAYDPADPETPPPPGAVRIQKRWTRLVVDWPGRTA